MSNVMEKDGFTLVKRGAKKKQKYKLKRKEVPAIEDLNETELDNFRKKFTSQILVEMEKSELFKFLRSIYEKNDIGIVDKIECLGLGSITNNRQSKYQLALLVQLKSYFNCSVSAYDPIFTKSDKIILSELDIVVEEVNTEGMKKTDGKTLFYMPHCPKPLINNILYSNWSKMLLKNVQIFGNSFENMIVRHTAKDLEKNAKYIKQSQKFIKEIAIPEAVIIDNIFSDTSLHYFHNTDILDIPFSKATPPIYDNEELDFVKK